MKKRLISSLLICSILISLCPFTVYGDGSSAVHVGIGNGQSSFTYSSIFTWDTSYKGLRFSVVDNKGNIVTKNLDVLDVLWNNVPSGAKRYYSNKFGHINDTPMMMLNNRYKDMTDEAVSEATARALNRDNPRLFKEVTNVGDGVNPASGDTLTKGIARGVFL